MEYLFHYTNENNIDNILKKQTLLFNNIYLTNDPYENKIFDLFDYKEMNKNIIDNEKQRFYFQHYTNMKNRIIKTMSFCMGDYNNKTITEDNRPAYLYPRMWAQYGNNSKGICLVFDKKKLLNHIEKQLSFDFNIFKHPNPYKREMLVNNMIDNIDKYFFIKDKDWAGEHEFRILIINKAHNNEIGPKKIKLDMSKVLHCVVLGENFVYRNEEEEQINSEKKISIIRSICKNKKIGLNIIKRDIYRSRYKLEKIV